MPSEESKTIRQQIQKETGQNEATLAEQRKAWIDYAKTLELHPDVSSREETIAGVPCLWLELSGSKKRATVVYLHGGGLVDGAIVTHREFVSRFVAETGYSALMVGYRLAPENRYPAALDDVISVYDALVCSDKIKGPLVFGGDSSGGGLALAALMQLRDSEKELPVCTFTISGVFDMTLSGESMRSRNDCDPCLSFEALEVWTRHFADYNLEDESLSPLWGRVEGLPPLLLQVGDDEVWLDDSRRLYRKIKDSGGAAELRIWDSMWHVWPMYSNLPEASDALKEIGEFLDTH